MKSGLHGHDVGLLVLAHLTRDQFITVLVAGK